MLADVIRISRRKGGVVTGEIPSYYELATDDDFSGTQDAEFIYIGTKEYVIIPNVIKGVTITSYYRMFYRNTVVLGVANYPNNIIEDMSYFFQELKSLSLDLSFLNTGQAIDMSHMFYNSLTTSFNLLSFYTSNVTTMYNMFYGSKATTVDLSSFDTANVTSVHSMFRSSSITLVYAGTEDDAAKFRSASWKPIRLVIEVKP